MTFLKISIPVYRRNEWKNLEKDGRIEVSSDVDNLSDGYQSLKCEIDKLIQEINAETRLAENVSNLEQQIEEKAFTLRKLTENIETATAHYESLKFFLQSLGIDPTAHRLTFDKQLLFQDCSVPDVEIAHYSSEF